MTRSVSALGLLGVGLFLIPVMRNPALWTPEPATTHAELGSLVLGFLCIVIDTATQRMR
jgi:hypothetical protein